MELVGRNVLEHAMLRYPDVRGWIGAWTDVVDRASWRSIADVRKIYPSADGVKLRSRMVVTIFNVKGNEYRLLTEIDYKNNVVKVFDLLTHASYDKGRWKGRQLR